MQLKELVLINMPVVVQEQVKPTDLAARCLLQRPRKTLRDSLRDVNAYALSNTIADTLPEANA